MKSYLVTVAARAAGSAVVIVSAETVDEACKLATGQEHKYMFGGAYEPWVYSIEDGPVRLPDGAWGGKPGNAHPVPPAFREPPTRDMNELLALVMDALAYEADAFDEDDDVNGGDLVEWFSGWRERAKALVGEIAPQDVTTAAKG